MASLSWIDNRHFPISLPRLILLWLPTALLGITVFRIGGDRTLPLAIGMFLTVIVSIIVLAWQRNLAPSIGTGIVICYMIGLTCYWFMIPPNQVDWFIHVAQALMAIVPMSIVIGYTIQHSGANFVRRARNLARKIALRRKWPSDLKVCRDLPEVKVFREVLIYDAAPALQLLREPSPQVRICALAALEFRRSWRPGQAQRILRHLKQEPIPEVRVAGIFALANLESRPLIEELAEYLRDPDKRVRQATIEALFWNMAARWIWIQSSVRYALSEPVFQHDGPLIHEGQILTPEAVEDFTAWANEKGVLSFRAAQTLLVHYRYFLYEQPDKTQALLQHIVLDPHKAPIFRMEMANLLNEQEMLEEEVLEKLLDSGNPAPLRLLAAESLLKKGPHTDAIVTLREVARLPNREIALETADIVQRMLGIDLGLALGQPLPSLNSSKALEITRRLMAWAQLPDQSEAVLEPSVYRDELRPTYFDIPPE